MSANPAYHTVTVTEGKVSFECAALYGTCHFYPDCDCEYWDVNHYREYGVGHEREHHDDCWMADWFENEPGASYVGDDYDDMQDNGIPPEMNRSGHIEASFNGEFVEWEFAS